MTTTPGPAAGSVIVGVDGSPLSDAALMWAAAQADRDRTALHVMHLVAALPAIHGVGVVDVGEPEELGRHVCEDAVSHVRAAHPDLTLTTEVLMGPAAPALIEASTRAGMVVVGARGHGRLSGMLLGSVSQQVAMHATCPVVVVRGEGRPDQAPVVVGADGSAGSHRALDFALRHAHATGAPVRAVHAEYIEPPIGVPAGSWYGQVVEVAQQRTVAVRATVDDAARAFPDVDVEFRLARQHPVAALVEASADASLLVVASRGLGGFAGLMLGSVSQGVLSRATVPVAILPTPDEDDAG